MTGACWSTAVSTESERVALGLGPGANWIVTCRLSDGHMGEHATDGGSGQFGMRRNWLFWDNSSSGRHRVVGGDPCPMRNASGVGCGLFAGHGGLHFYAAPESVPSAATGRPGTGPAVRRAVNGVHLTLAPVVDVSSVDDPGIVDAAIVDVSVVETRGTDGPTAAPAPEPPPAAPEPRRVAESARPISQAQAPASAAGLRGLDESDPVVVALVDLSAALENLAIALRQRPQ